MADNYLEKKMEEHRRGGAPSYRPRLTPRGTRPGEWLVKFTPCEVFIADAGAPLMPEVIGELAGAGFRVTFSMADTRLGALLAQRSGARFLPPSVCPDEASACSAATPGQKLVISSRGETVEISDGSRAARLLLPDGTPDAVKTVVWEAIMLANFNRFSEKMLRNIKIERVSL